MSSPPCVILIDDRDATHLIPKSCASDHIAPDDVSAAHGGEHAPPRRDLAAAVRRADLMLIDQELELTDELSLAPLDGASIVGVFRSWARKHGSTLPPLVIFTANPNAYEREVPAVGLDAPLAGSFVGSEHRLAPILDVEWLLFKDDPHVGAKVESLAFGYAQTREVVGENGTSLPELSELLKVPQNLPWTNVAAEQLRRARPPVSQAGDVHREAVSRGPAHTVRWLLHRALPFAGLFLSELFVAWSLNVTPSSFKAFLRDQRSRDTSLFIALSQAQYRGPLDTLFDTRWWRAGVDAANDMLLQLADRAGGLRAALDEAAGKGILEPAPTRDSVVVYDDNFVPTDIVSIEEAVELNVPGWPAEVMPPWARTEEVRRDPLMAALVDDSAFATRLPDGTIGGHD